MNGPAVLLSICSSDLDAEYFP